VNSEVEFRLGMASWTDPTLVKSDLFYPPSVRNAEERLRFYAEHFKSHSLCSPDRLDGYGASFLATIFQSLDHGDDKLLHFTPQVIEFRYGDI
jgi:hypothetical protein